MRLRAATQQNDTPGYNLVVEVTGFGKTPDGKATTVKGNNLETGEAVEVALSNKGALADNPQRKSLADFEKGFKVGPNKYTLVPGGIMSFRAAGWESKPGEPKVAYWADALAFNAESARDTVKSGLVTLRVFEREGKKPNGVLTIYEEDKIASAPKAADLLPALVQHQKDAGGRAGILARYVKDEEVVGLAFMSASYDKEAKAERRPEAAAKMLVEKMAEGASKVGANRVDIIPTIRLTILSAMAASASGKDQMPKWRGLEGLFIKKLEDGERELLAKKSYFTVGGDNLDFVNDVKVLDPSGPGVDPGLMSKTALRYASALDTPNNQAPEVPHNEAGEHDGDDHTLNELGGDEELDAKLNAALG